MIFLRQFILLLPSLCALQGVVGQTSDNAPREVRRLIVVQDGRRMEDSVVFRAMENPDPVVRSRALTVCAHLPDARHAVRIGQLLSDPSRSVRIAAAFALGRLGGEEAVRALLLREKEEMHPDVRSGICDALGRILPPESLDSCVGERLHDPLPGPRLREMMQMVARAVLRGVTPANFVECVTRGAASTDRSARYWTAYALSRTREAHLLREARRSVGALAGDASAETRMAAVTAASRLDDPDFVDARLLRALSDPDWRVVVNALRGFALQTRSPGSGVADQIAGMLGGRNEHLRICALQYFARTADRLPDKDRHASFVLARSIAENRKETSAVRREALLAMARLEPDSAFLRLLALQRLAAIDTISLIEAYGACGRGDLSSLFGVLGVTGNARMHTAALSVLRQGFPAADERMRAWTRQFYIDSFDSRDIAVLTAVAEACQDSAVRTDGGQEFSRAASEVLDALSSPADVEPIVALCDLLGLLGDVRALPALQLKMRMDVSPVRVAAARAISRLGGEMPVLPEEAIKADRAPRTDLEKLQTRGRVRVIARTLRGEFEMEFIRDNAPVSVMKILRLIDRRFYDGLTFHRVVQNFVIQGGDPRGDGWGGPGWAMRSEFSPARFERGTVGLASAGNDTEGSQFFVTHCDTPHLDGRYTILGRVVRGQSVVDRIQVGDTILSMRRAGQKEHLR